MNMREILDEAEREDGPSKTPSEGVQAEGGSIHARWTAGLAEERLIEATACWRRDADRSAGWHHVKAFWPDVRQEYDWWYDYRTEGAPAPLRDMRVPVLPLSQAERVRMMEASAWIGAHVRERDRKLVSIVLVIKAGGHRPDWRRVMQAIGVARGIEGVRKRYVREMDAVAAALNRARVPVVMAGI